MRNYRPALWPAFTTLVFGGMAFVLSRTHVPSPVVALPGLVGFIAALVLFRPLLGRTRMTARADWLTISDNLKLLRTPIRFNINEIEDIQIKVAFQLFDDPYYRLVVIRRGTFPYTIRAVIASKRDAEWLANEIKKHLRLHTDG